MGRRGRGTRWLGFAPELAFAAGVLSLGVCFFGVVKLAATLIGAGVGWEIAVVGSAAVGYAVLFVVVEALFGWLFGPLSSMWVYLAPPVAGSTARRCPRCGRVEPTRCQRCGRHDDGPVLDVDDVSGSRPARDAYRRAWIVLPASLSEQYLQTSDAAVPVDKVEPGDLLFLSNGRPGAVDQVVICAGRKRGRTKVIDVQGRPARCLDPDTSFTATRPLESQGVERLRRPALPRSWRRVDARGSSSGGGARRLGWRGRRGRTASGLPGRARRRQVKG